MPISSFYQALRDRVGTDLLMMPAVAAVLRDRQGRILAQQTHDLNWSLPAGAVEPGEAPALAITREVREETGLIVRATRVLGVVGGPDCRIVYANGDQVEYVVTVFECEAVAGTLIESNEETRALRWFALPDMPPLPFPYDEAILRGQDPDTRFDWDETWLTTP